MDRKPGTEIEKKMRETERDGERDKDRERNSDT